MVSHQYKNQRHPNSAGWRWCGPACELITSRLIVRVIAELQLLSCRVAAESAERAQLGNIFRGKSRLILYLPSLPSYFLILSAILIMSYSLYHLASIDI